MISSFTEAAIAVMHTATTSAGISVISSSGVELGKSSKRRQRVENLLEMLRNGDAQGMKKKL